MQVGHFPASAANSLIEGYCEDFVSFAAILAQTLEQISMRGLDIESSRPKLQLIESGMRELANAIHDLLERGKVASNLTTKVGGTNAAAPPPPEAPPPQPPQPTKDQAQRFSRTSTEPLQTQGRTGAAQQVTRPIQANELPPRGARPTGPAPAPVRRGPGAPAAVAGKFEAAPQEDASGTLRGTNASMPVRSVFQFIGRMRKSGVLKIQLSDELLTFEFLNGCVQACASSVPAKGERLGELLVEISGCNPQQLARLLQRSQPSMHAQLGDLVVCEGLASNGQVLEALELQVRRRFTRASKSPNASYEFRDGLPERNDGRIQISPAELVFEPVDRTPRRPS